MRARPWAIGSGLSDPQESRIAPMPRRKASPAGRKCSICKHPDRVAIEAARAAGASLDAIADRFGVSRDAVHRHWRHVSEDLKAAYIADAPLVELAAKAAAENVTILDMLALTRSTLVTQMLTAASVNDGHRTANLAGKVIQTLETIAKLTGQMMNAAPVSNVTNNTIVMMSSPLFVRLERMLLERLGPHPDALRAVLDGLRELETTAAPMPALPHAGEVIDAAAA